LRIFVAGHRGLVGSALVRQIEARSELEWLGAARSDLDLLNREAVFQFLSDHRPEAVIIAAAKVGGILANRDHPVQFLSENLLIQTNLLDAAHNARIEKVVFLGSSCIYPRLSPQPIQEEYLLTGELEPTNEPYAIAKIAGLKLIQAYRRQFGHRWISVMPTNLYGPGDNFNPEESHVLPGMIQKFHTAKILGLPQVALWGTGSPRREFLHSDDLARACLFLLGSYDDDVPINVGSGDDVMIRDLANLVKDVVGYEGDIIWDDSKPDGTPRKLLDVHRLKDLGWEAEISLPEGIKSTYDWYQDQKV
jgi:GDP-L-fucose synthase